MDKITDVNFYFYLSTITNIIISNKLDQIGLIRKLNTSTSVKFTSHLCTDPLWYK